MRKKRTRISSGKISLFLAGFALMALAHFTIQCEKFTSPPDDNGGDIVVDSKQATSASKALEKAFLTGNSEKVLELVSPASLEHYSDLINGSSEDDLKAFGEAFKTREIKIISESYAEFEFTAEGKVYSVALTLDEDESWKLMRL